ncbi:GTPase-activating protein gyp7 [Macrolepiota fuliginosa MF-IS2]|uniref:GTPase-activating protein gyp7 n=1 Tax=Macrolepiota fuliginosa MF-IS2 TaxID=1400762 RepID=A0A9P5XMH5_9AGAR|nr:GTPase-activating protein gyp7 [Macrolepiota fuliginosa MF-IS2]
MVEITRPNPTGSSSPPVRSGEEDRYRLVYSKSKVYVNPTAYARDNISGFVALVKREAQNPTYLLAWIPESLLNEKGSTEWDKFVKIEEKTTWDQEDDDVVLIDLPTQRPESYAFSVPLTSIYSLIVQPPSLSSWYGSIGINLINGDTLPTLHFHDDESHSFILQSPVTSRSGSKITTTTTTTQSHPGTTSYPPPPPLGQSSHQPRPINSWGGEDLLSRLRLYAHILRSTLQPTLFLVDPSRSDVEAHTTQVFEDDAVDDILAQSSFANSHSPVPAHRRPQPITIPNINAAAGNTTPNIAYSHRSSVLHRSLGSAASYAYAPGSGGSPGSSSAQARLALLQSFSNITRATRHAAQNILSHPLAKPIVPHLPDPVKSLVSAPGEWEWGSWVEKGGVGEFESARVYLARWARIVAEEGERARKREAQALPSVYAENDQEASSLGIFELLHTTANLPTPKSSRSPERPVDEKQWAKWFDGEGRPKIRAEEFKREVFRRGVCEKGELRKKVWPFLLDVFEWGSSAVERERFWRDKRKKYQEVKDQWCGVPEVFDRQDVIEERHRIDVDCRRTDRAQPLFVTPAATPGVETDTDDEKKAHLRYSTISPHLDDVGAQAPSNEHIERLASILLTYNFYEKELGYVQGMSDLCAPIYVVMDADEEMTFWCFVRVMERMKKNFLRDQSGMKKQLSTLQQLIEVMDPELFRHLEKTDGLNLFFCFRWVLIAFKREFPFEEVLRLWEVLWTDYYSTGFVLFVALAVLESHRDMILRYLVEFDEILKYCNELSMTIELDTTLAQAEVLFLSFAQLVADIDRRKAEEASSSNNGLRNRISGSSSANNLAKQTNLSLLKLSDELRELLVSGA